MRKDTTNYLLPKKNLADTQKNRTFAVDFLREKSQSLWFLWLTSHKHKIKREVGVSPTLSRSRESMIEYGRFAYLNQANFNNHEVTVCQKRMGRHEVGCR